MKLEKVPAWCDEAEAGLSQTLGSDRDLLARDVNAGRLELWKINDGESWMITRMEAGELIVCCYQGKKLAAAAQVLYRIAQRNQCTAVRFFSESPRLVLALRKFPVKLCGYVYRCEVAPHVA